MRPADRTADAPARAIEYAREIGEEDEDAGDDPDRWLPVQNTGSRAGCRDMQQFIGTVRGSLPRRPAGHRDPGVRRVPPVQRHPSLDWAGDWTDETASPMNVTAAGRGPGWTDPGIPRADDTATTTPVGRAESSHTEETHSA